MISRRTFLSSSAVTVGFLSLRRVFAADAPPLELPQFGYGPLVPDPAGVIDLPAGFSYKIFSRTGQIMDDALRVPGMHDGMATFAGPNGLTILVRNHELLTDPSADSAFGPNNEGFSRISPGKLYDAGYGKTPAPGGTVTLVYNTKDQMLERHYLSLAGTCRNCAGGPTPWGSWITCEETVVRKNEDKFEQDHGYNFEVPASVDIGLADPTPIKAMGRFNHEAVAVDPASGIVYQTEDRSEGLLYRYIPNVKGKLLEGGKLQALRIRDKKSFDTRNWEKTRTLEPGQALDVDWVDLEDVESPTDELRMWGYYARGAARFARGEGMWTGKDGIYFACTNGGTKKQGQIFRYTPSPNEGTADEAKQPGKLELFIEPNNSELMRNADNLTIAPWGDVVFAEDCGRANRLVGVTKSSQLYTFARNVMNDSEFAGCCFSPDGTTLFANIQNPGLTLAITGAWRSQS